MLLRSTSGASSSSCVLTMPLTKLTTAAVPAASYHVQSCNGHVQPGSCTHLLSATLSTRPHHTNSNFLLIRCSMPNKDELLQRLPFKHTKLKGAFFNTANSVDRVSPPPLQRALQSQRVLHAQQWSCPSCGLQRATPCAAVYPTALNVERVLQPQHTVLQHCKCGQ